MDMTDEAQLDDEAANIELQQNDFELPIAPFQGTPEEIERQWFEKVYRGRGDSMAQLTWRAVLMGSVLGCVLSLTNLYMGLKTGWGFGVAITACILSYAVWSGLFRLGLVRTRMTILENNCMQSTASSAGYSTGGTLISAFAAYMILNNQPLSIPLTLAWVFFIAVLGVTMAIPMKRQMVNVDQLRFPSGIAAAETLKVLYSHGDKGARSARALGIASLVAAVNQFWIQGFGLIHFAWNSLRFSLEALSGEALLERLNDKLFGGHWVNRTVLFDWDLALVAGGALTGMRASASMFLGGTLCWAVFVPLIQHNGYVPLELDPKTAYRDLILWTLWGGVSCMITSSLLSFAFQWRSAVRAFSSMAQAFTRGRHKTTDAMSAIEVPFSWFLGGQLFALVGLAWLANVSFHMPLWQSILAVLLTFVLALVACRVTGETDTTPIGAMGKVTQLIFGALSPGNMNVNLMSANITAGAAGSAADLLTDLKSGYLLGANPRKQFLAQFAGVFSGTIVTVVCFRVLVPNASYLGEKFPAPAAMAWSAVARVLSEGIASLGTLRAWTIVVGGLIGIILPLLGKAFPKYEKWIPSAAGLGLAWTFPWSNSLMFFLGAMAAWIWEKVARKQSDEFLFPVASGLVAGGTLMAVAIIFYANGPEVIKQFLQH
jgi:OPT family oligopeptide transporter